jgi:CRP-like cAMP-binding protein
MEQKAHSEWTFRGDRRLSASHPLKALDNIVTIKQFGRAESVCDGETSSNFWYRVLSGAAKRFATLPNGRQQIVDLLLPGDIFACLPDESCNVSVEAAAEATMLACYPVRRVETLAASDPRVARLRGEIALATVGRLQTQLLILGRTTALEKIGAFLLVLAQRQTGEIAQGVVLPISRYDIADYLALSVETVSRSLTGLKERGLISFATTRNIRIVDRHALEEGSASYPLPRRAELPHSRFSSDGARFVRTARRMASASL